MKIENLASNKIPNSVAAAITFATESSVKTTDLLTKKGDLAKDLAKDLVKDSIGTARTEDAARVVDAVRREDATKNGIKASMLVVEDKEIRYINTLKKFNWHTYLRFNKDLIPFIKSETEAFQHYEKHGQYEGRLRSVVEFYQKFPFFNSELYRKSHGDLGSLNREDLMSHYWYNGQHEKRITAANPNHDDFLTTNSNYPNFDIDFYRNYYSDLQTLSDSELLAHYLAHGQTQGRLKNSFEQEICNFLLNYDKYVILFSRIEDILVNNKPINYRELSEPIKDLDADLYTDLVSELGRLTCSPTDNNTKNKVAIFVIDFYSNLKTDEYKKSYQIPDNVGTVFSKSKTIPSSGVGHFYIRSENIGIIDRLTNPSFIFVRGNNVPMINRLGTVFNKALKIFYPATSLTYQKNKWEKNTVLAANYQLYNAASISLDTSLDASSSSSLDARSSSSLDARSLVNSPNSPINTSNDSLKDLKDQKDHQQDQKDQQDRSGPQKKTGYDILLIDDRHIYDYMKRTKFTASRLVLFTKYAVDKKDKDAKDAKESDVKELKLLKNSKNSRYDLLYTSYTKGPTKNFNIFFQFISYLCAKNSTLSVLVLNKDDNDDLENLRKLNYPHLKIIITSQPDLFYDYCNNHLLTSGRDAQPRTITETLSKGVHNIVLDTLTNGLYIFKDTKIFGTIIPTNKTYKGKHYIPVPDRTLFENIEKVAKTRQNKQRILKFAYDVLSRDKLVLDLIGTLNNSRDYGNSSFSSNFKETTNNRFVVTFATIDYSNMASLLLNSIIKTNPDVITIMFCLNWEPSAHQVFRNHYANHKIIFVPYSAQLRNKNDILITKVKLIQLCYKKLEHDFIWIDADSMVLSDMTPLYNLFKKQKKEILVFLRLDSKNEFEKVALGVIGFAGSNNKRTGQFIDVWANKVDTLTNVANVKGGKVGKTAENVENVGKIGNDWFADQIGFYRTMMDNLISESAIHGFTNSEHSINGEENTIIYSRRRNNKRSISDLAMERGINANMLIIPGINYTYIDQTVDHYSLLFVTYDYPSNGGAATNLYAIYNIYKQMGVTACIVFINEQPIPSELEKEFKKDPNVFFFSSSTIDLQKPKSILQKKKFKVLIFKIYKTLSFLEKNGLSTNWFKKIIYLCSGLSTYEPLSKITKNIASYSLKRKEELYPIERSHKVIFNSDLTETLYNRMVRESEASSTASLLTTSSTSTSSSSTTFSNASLPDSSKASLLASTYSETLPLPELAPVTLPSTLSKSGSEIGLKKTKVLNTTLLGMNKDDFMEADPSSAKSWLNRSIDLIYVVSDCYRKVKNADLIYHLYRRPELNNLKKMIIGLNADMILARDVPNTTIYNINMSRNEVLKYLRDSKILLLPSHFDSSPNILYEALLSGCNVIASKNIGNVEILPAQNIVQLEMNASIDAAKFASLIPANLKDKICQEPSLNAEPKKILDDLILLD